MLMSKPTLHPILAAVILCLMAGSSGQAENLSGAGEDWATLKRKAMERPRRLLYNNDGNEAMSMPEFSIEKFLEMRTTRLAGTQIDSIFYCTGPGFGLYLHDTNVGQVFTTREGRYDKSRVEEFLKAGSDPLKEIVKFCHAHDMEAFWSMRMNDTHDGSTKSYGPVLFAANELKKNHPERLLGSEANPPHHGKWSGVNYEIPEIREKALRIIEEVCQKYDVDGVELDFFRHPTYFKYPAKNQAATDMHRQVMTDLMKQVRRMTEVEGKKRGRPFLVAIKVPDSVEYCRTVGIDLEQWLKEGLIDLLITNGYFRLNAWDYSVRLGHKYGVKVYPSLDDPRIEDKDGQKLRESANAFRGQAMEVLAAGADGVYLYNFFKEKSPYEILREAGDQKILQTKSRDYFGSVLGKSHVAGGAYPHASFQKTETLNPEDPVKITPGGKAEARLDVPENFAQTTPRKLKLMLRFREGAEGKALKVTLNEKELAGAKTNKNWLEFDLAGSDGRMGQNDVEVTLDASEKSPVWWEDLTLQVRP